jgi:hypothetical protein
MYVLIKHSKAKLPQKWLESEPRTEISGSDSSERVLKLRTTFKENRKNKVVKQYGC